MLIQGKLTAVFPMDLASTHISEAGLVVFQCFLLNISSGLTLFDDGIYPLFCRSVCMIENDVHTPGVMLRFLPSSHCELR